MKLSERSYSGKILRPRPAIHVETDGSLIVISTSWGGPDAATQVNEEIVKYVQAATADVEVTSPFGFSSNLSDESNYLRIATLIMNERLYRSDNRSEYVTGVETLALFRKGTQLAYAKVGGPHLLLQKTSGELLPVSTSLDLSSQMEFSDESLPPLPQDLLGADVNVNIQTGDLRIANDETLFLYAGRFFPPVLWNGLRAQADVNLLTQKLAQARTEAPFWLGRIDFNEN